MKKKILLLGLMIVSVFACETKTTTTVEADAAVDVDKIKSEIQALETAYANAMNAKDVKALMPFYADDAESYESGMEPIIGKKALTQSLTERLAAMPDGIKLSFTTGNLVISSNGSHVVETGSYTVSDADGSTLNGGNYMSVFENRDGKYVCVREMITAGPEAE